MPADGTYYLHLSDAQRQGGPAYGYRLRISAPRPDFELRVVPSTINARPGMCVPITVYALRKDGFSGDIALTLKDAPKGFALSGARIPGNQDRVRLTLTIPPAAPDSPSSLHMEGRALIQGRDITRPAVPAEDMMQAFYYHHLVPAQDMVVAVTGRGLLRVPASTLGDKPVSLPVGGTAQVRFTLPPGLVRNQPHLELNEPPEGITIKSVESTADGVTITLQADAAKAKPGLKGNLIIDAFNEPRASTAAPGKPQVNQRRVQLGTLPAVPFEIAAGAR